MSTLRNLLKVIPSDIKSELNFLELGYCAFESVGNNFKDTTGFLTKTSVDIENTEATYPMSTDDFFKQNKKKYDIIYIDAGHDIENVLKDYNNSIKSLTDKGFIVLHDMYPPNHTLAQPGYCGNGWILLNHFYKMGVENMMSFLPDVGTTIFGGPYEHINREDLDFISYDELLVNSREQKWDKLTESIEDFTTFFMSLVNTNKKI